MSEPNDTRDAPAGATATGSTPPDLPPATRLGADAQASAEAAVEARARGDAAASSAADAPTRAGGAQGDRAGGDAGEGDAGDGDEADDEADRDGAAGEGSSAGATSATDGVKKKRRRRRKKKGATSAGGEAAPDQAAQAGGDPKAARPKKELAHQAFGRFFEATPGARRHAFSAGEIVAGRVVRAGDGAFVVDLFGKALAVVDEVEPHEVELPVEAPAAEPSAAEGTAGDAEAPSEAGAAPQAASAAGAAEVAGESGAASSVSAPGTGGGADARGSADAASAAEADAEAAAEAARAVEAEAERAAAEDDAAEDAAAAAPPEQGAAPAADGGGAAAPEDAPAAPEDEPAPRPLPEIGSVFRGRVGAVAESGHIAILNRIIDTKAARARIAAAREARRRVRGLVFGYNRGGFDVLVYGVRAFCPASGMSLGPIDDPAEFVGKKLEFSVPLAKPGTHGLVLSRRAILEREARRAQKERLKELKVGDRVRGRVSQVRDFGLFVDLGHGLEGMIHVSELSWDRGAKPSDVASVGDELEALVIKIPDRRERKERHERVGLSLKATQTDPWVAAGELLEEGRALQGKVTRVAEFGAFVEIAPGIEGLLHVSELGDKLAHAKEGAKEGDLVWVVIERTDRKAHRVALSKLGPSEVKALESGELTPEAIKAAKPPKQGASIQVVVDKVEHHGLLVQVRGVLGRRGRGYIPNSEMGTERGTDHRKLFPPGTELEVKVIGTDRDGGLKLSRKALRADEEKRAVQDYRREAQKQGFGTFGDLLRAKLGGDKA
jgi:small subunit ribosomal protein S1